MCHPRPIFKTVASKAFLQSVTFFVLFSRCVRVRDSNERHIEWLHGSSEDVMRCLDAEFSTQNSFYIYIKLTDYLVTRHPFEPRNYRA